MVAVLDLDIANAVVFGFEGGRRFNFRSGNNGDCFADDIARLVFLNDGVQYSRPAGSALHIFVADHEGCFYNQAERLTIFCPATEENRSARLMLSCWSKVINPARQAS